MSNGKGRSCTMKPQFPDLPALLATFSKKNFSDFSLCKILMIDFQISCNGLATNYYFFGLGISSFLLLGSWKTSQQNLLIGISSCLSFWNPACDSNFYWDLLLNFETLDEPPCYVWQCYRLVNLKGCLGVRCCKCKCVCTTIHNARLLVLFSLGVSQNKEGINVTVFTRYNLLLQLFVSNITIP